MAIDRRPSRLRLAAALALMLAGGGCTVGPDFRPDPVASATAPARWPALPASAATDDGLASRAVERPLNGRRWWGVFADPTLDALVDEALRQNLDVATAVARIGEARARRQLAAGSELPSVGLSGIAGRQRMSENGIGSVLGGAAGGGAEPGAAAPSAPASNLFQAGFDAMWELDLWGGTRRNVEAAVAGTESAEAALGEARVSLGAEVVRTYLELRGAQRQRAIVETDLAAQQRLLALTESQARTGLATRSDPLRASADLAQLQAQLPQIAQTIGQSTERLASLLGLPPGGLGGRLGPAGADPALPPELPVGLPGELLRRRPDIVRTEAELHAATARVGAAEAQLYPSITLGGVAGFQATTAGQLAAWGSRFFAAGAQVSMPLFQGGRLKAQVLVADAQLQEALLDYRRTVLAAFHDADSALIAYGEEQRRAGSLERQTSDLDRSRALVADRYRTGLAPLTDVLQIERQLHQSQLAVLQSKVQASTNLVALYKALGGDWAPAER